MNNDLYEIALITGAGAHCPYGLPSGNELKRDIISLLGLYGDRRLDDKIRNNRQLYNFYDDMAYDVVEILSQVKDKKHHTSHYIRHGNKGTPLYEKNKEFVKKFIHKFISAQTDSIDLYISRKTATEEDKLIGKILIGAILNHYERVIEVGLSERNWIQTIINRYVIPENGLEFFKNGPAYITFNYDRLFEYSLLHNLISHHDLTIKEALEQLNHLRVVHVYGSLGEIRDDKFGVFSSSDVENIDVVRKGDIKHSDQILMILREVKRIYIFGFSFNQVNIDVLFDRLSKSQWGMTEKKEIFCTSIGLSQIEKNKLLKKFSHKVNVHIIFFDGLSVEQVLSAEVPLELEVDIKQFAMKWNYRSIS